MSAVDRVTSNRNFLSAVQSEFAIRRLPDVEFFCQAVDVPGVTLGYAAQRNPLVDIKKPGETVSFDELSVTFKVDEWMENYCSVLDWITGLGFPETSDQYLRLSDKPAWSDEGVFSDCSVFLLDSRGRQRIEVVVHDAFPVSLSRMRVDSRSERTEFVTATANFAYTRLEVSRVK